MDGQAHRGAGLGNHQGQTTVAEASRAYDLPPSAIETWVEDGKQGLENALCAKPLDIKEQCAHRQRFETLQHASRVLADWIQFYNTHRPHQALAMKTPAEAFRFAA